MKFHEIHYQLKVHEIHRQRMNFHEIHISLAEENNFMKYDFPWGSPTKSELPWTWPWQIPWHSFSISYFGKTFYEFRPRSVKFHFPNDRSPSVASMQALTTDFMNSFDPT